MKSWCQLPTELLECIFQHIHDSTNFFQYQLVCKNWCKTAQISLYKEVHITSHTQFISFANAMLSTSNGPLIETLSTIKKEGQENYFPLDKETINAHFPVILKYCSNMKSIMMKKFKFSASLYAAIDQERIYSGGCLSLENIPPPNTTDENNMYWYGRATWAIRDNLKILVLRDDYVDPKWEPKLAEKLGWFPCLHSFSFFIDRPETTLLQVFLAVGEWDSIQSLRICKMNSDYIRFSEHPNDNIKHSVSNIKRLNVETVICEENLIKFLKNEFSKLEYMLIRFEIRKTIFRSMLPLQKEDMLISTDTCVDFLKWISNKLKEFNVQNIMIRDPLDVANKLLGSDSFIIVNFELKYNDIRDWFMQFITAVKNQSGIYFSLNLEEAGEIDSPILPHQSLIDKYGVKFKRLSLDFSSAFDGNLHSHYNHLHGYIFDYIFKNCPTLKCLRMGGLTLNHCDPDMVQNDWIDELTVDHCDIEDGGAIFTDLSERLPNLKFLSLGWNYFEDEHDIKLIMPHTAFESIIWMFPRLGPGNCRYFLKISFGYNGSTSYYVEDENGFHMTDGEPNYNSGASIIEIECNSIQTLVLFIDDNTKAIIKNPSQMNQEIIKNEDVVYSIREEYQRCHNNPFLSL